jgi:glucose/arabinose dehydrogenase
MKIRSLLVAIFLFLTTPCYAAPSLTDPSLKVEQVVTGLDTPTTMAFIGDNDILVLQKNDGKVMRVIDGVLQPVEVLDVNVANDSEHGLLGIALHPDFATNHLVYLYYTESNTDGGSALGNRVYKYLWDDTTGTLTLADATPILDLPAASSNHNGGVIIFGPPGDEKLYVIIGDQNRNGQLQNFADPAPGPDDTSVILRLNDDGSVPSDNPFHSLGDPMNKYYAYGIRNSFGMAFDPVTDKLWDTENGENTFDEINLVDPGFNSGWESIMGPASRPENAGHSAFVIPGSGSHYADPKFSWFNTVAPTAIVFLDSANLGVQYENDAFVGDFNNGILYHFQPNQARNGFILTSQGLSDLVADPGDNLNGIIFGTGFGGQFSGITDLKVGPDGLLYVLSISGTIYRISLADAPPFFNASSLPDAEVGVDYSADLGTGGGTAPYTVMVVKGSLPNGLTVDSGGISGIPTSSTKKSVFTLQVTDQVPASSTKQFRIKVLKALSISTQTLKRAKVGKNYKASLKVTGGKAPYTWTLDSGTFPAWAQLSPSGVITGVPPAPDSQTFTLQVIDALGGTDLSQSLTLTAN